MKRIIIMLIAIFCMLLAHMLPLVNSASAAGLVVSATPNPAILGQVTTITVIASDEQSMYQWGGCDLLVYFGDGTPAPNIGKLTWQNGANMKSTTHNYPRYGTFTIEVFPVACATKPPSVNTSVRINLPRKAVLPR